jgi:hypothetical protein
MQLKKLEGRRLFVCKNSGDPPHLNAICDRLMREGIDGLVDEVAALRTNLLSDTALRLGRKDGLACALTWFETLEQKNIQGEVAIHLDFNRANAFAGQRYGTNWQWEQPTLAREMYYLRRAISHPDFVKASKVIRCQCLNNLGNRLRAAGRFVEALEYWRRTLELQPDFGMALCNRTMVYASYSQLLEHPEDQVLFLLKAHQEACAALAPTAKYTSEHDEGTRKVTQNLREWLESVLDLKGIAASGVDPFEGEDSAATEEEHAYRQWCLVNCLYLNPLNDLGPYGVAAIDSVSLGTHLVPVDAPHMFESFFDQMKQEYVSARWLLFQGLNMRTPHFSDRDVLVGATEPRPSLSFAVEQVKVAYRVCYSLFDKIAFFVNAYMKLDLPLKRVSFRTIWRDGENRPLRVPFNSSSNGAFCALYWLSKDFFENANDEVAEPEARALSDLRNHLEHKYLRVTEAEPTIGPSGDLAFMVSRERFGKKAVHLLKLARSALAYLVVGVRLEEQSRKPDRAGLPIEELPATSPLPDAEKM